MRRDDRVMRSRATQSALMGHARPLCSSRLMSTLRIMDSIRSSEKCLLFFHTIETGCFKCPRGSQLIRRGLPSINDSKFASLRRLNFEYNQLLNLAFGPLIGSLDTPHAEYRCSRFPVLDNPLQFVAENPSATAEVHGRSYRGTSEGVLLCDGNSDQIPFIREFCNVSPWAWTTPNIELRFLRAGTRMTACWRENIARHGACHCRAEKKYSCNQSHPEIQWFGY